MLIRCCENLFTESLPTNERLLCFRYSGFQASYHNSNEPPVFTEVANFLTS
jgi:hypothetical protein